MSSPPTTAELHRRLVALWWNLDDVPPERRLQFAQLIDRLERLKDDDADVWAY